MNRRATLLFVSLGLAWGIPYLLIKVAVEELNPLTLVLARTCLAALLLLPIAVAKGAVATGAAALAAARGLLRGRDRRPLAVPHPRRAAHQQLAGRPADRRRAVRVGGRGRCLRPPRAARARWAWAACCSASPAWPSWSASTWAARSSAPSAEMAVVVACYATGAAMLGRWMGDLPGIGVVAVSVVIASLVYAPFADPRPAAATCRPARSSSRVAAAGRGLHRGGVPAALRPGRRDRPGPGDHHHLPEPGGRGARRRPDPATSRSRSGPSSGSRSCSPAASGVARSRRDPRAAGAEPRAGQRLRRSGGAPPTVPAGAAVTMEA